jgi:hypothetical protein
MPTSASQQFGGVGESSPGCVKAVGVFDRAFNDQMIDLASQCSLQAIPRMPGDFLVQADRPLPDARRGPCCCYWYVTPSFDSKSGQVSGFRNRSFSRMKVVRSSPSHDPPNGGSPGASTGDAMGRVGNGRPIGPATRAGAPRGTNIAALD